MPSIIIIIIIIIIINFHYYYYYHHHHQFNYRHRGNFSLYHRVQTGSGAHPTSYPMGTGGFFPGSKTAGA
jgi:hypothetical protein